MYFKHENVNPIVITYTLYIVCANFSNTCICTPDTICYYKYKFMYIIMLVILDFSNICTLPLAAAMPNVCQPPHFEYAVSAHEKYMYI